MNTSYQNLTLRGNTLLSIPESTFSSKEISSMMDIHVALLVLDLLKKDITSQDEPIVTEAKSMLLDTVAAETLGSLANTNKLDVIRVVRHLYDCGLGTAKEITELFMGLKVEQKSALPFLDTVHLFIIEI
jgi:ribosomal protein L7/L12